MPTSLTVETEHSNDGRLVLSAAGEIDLSNIAEFEKALADATSVLARGGGTLTVDLSAVEYLDSAAINALCARSQHIRLIAPPLLMSTLTMSGLTELVEVEVASPQGD